LDVPTGHSLKIPLLVYTQDNETGFSEFMVEHSAPHYTLKDAMQQGFLLTEKSVNKDSASFSCAGSVDYESDLSSVICLAAPGTRLCMESTCIKTNSSGQVMFVVKKKPGQYVFRIRDESSGASLLSNMVVLPVPRVVLGSVEIPEQVRMNDTFRATWNTAFVDEPQATEVLFFINKAAVQSWNPSGDSAYEMLMSGGLLLPGQNVIDVSAKWEDAKGRRYNETITVKVFLQTTWWERFLIWLQRILV